MYDTERSETLSHGRESLVTLIELRCDYHTATITCFCCDLAYNIRYEPNRKVYILMYGVIKVSMARRE